MIIALISVFKYNLIKRFIVVSSQQKSCLRHDCLLAGYSFSYWFLLWNQISGIARGQRQIMHQLDSLSNLLRESSSSGERSHQVRSNRKSIIMAKVEPIAVPIMFSLAIGGLGIFLIKGFLTRSWFLHPVGLYRIRRLFQILFQLSCVSPPPSCNIFPSAREWQLIYQWLIVLRL